MTYEQTLDYVKETLECEGVEYGLTSYSDFSQVQDEKFHELRKAFLKAHKDLCEYLDIDCFA